MIYYGYQGEIRPLMIMNFLIFTAQQHKQVINSLKEHKSGGAELTSHRAQLSLFSLKTETLQDV